MIERAQLVGLISALLFLSGCVTNQGPEQTLQRFEFEQPQMGVPFRIVLYAADAGAAENAAKAAFHRIEELNTIMSDYETDSEISKLSRSSEEGSPDVPVGEDLWKVLFASQKLAEQTGGAFDVTVGPSVALWRKARREQQLPDPVRLENARRKVGYTNLTLNAQNHTARLLKRGMRLDVGGIAKGYAADEAIRTLRQLGIDRALVAASGDLSLGNPPPGSTGWRIEIVGYDQTNSPPSAVTLLANCGVSTSGDLFQRLEIDGVRYSHILNPFTGVGMTNHALATVIAKDCTTADSLATACTIVSDPDALRMADRYKAAIRVVRHDANGSVLITKNKRFDKAIAHPPVAGAAPE